MAIEFFEQKVIIDKLNQFSEFKIKGWEIWFQVEFTLFLLQHSRVSEVEREKRYELDQRKSKEKLICSIDFLIREKYKQSFIPLEVKQHYQISSCIRHMVKDIEKYEKIKGSSVTTGRALWCLGVHPKSEDEFYLARLINENKFRIFHPDLIFYKQIENTDFMFTLL